MFFLFQIESYRLENGWLYFAGKIEITFIFYFVVFFLDNFVPLRAWPSKGNIFDSGGHFTSLLEENNVLPVQAEKFLPRNRKTFFSR